LDPERIVTTRRGGSQVIPRPDEWRFGASPTWLQANAQHNFSLSHIEARLGAHIPADQPAAAGVNDEWLATARASAVLVPFMETEDGVSVVLTRRADHLKNHRGEVSFPGGRVEESESLIEAAIREAEEEINLDSTLVRVVGQLDPHATFVSNSLIVPIVAIVERTAQFVANESEVSRIITVPLTELAHPDSYVNEWWNTPRGELNIHFFYLHDETIWGATGRILRQVFDVLC
jgi:8-oxo-dGTP pyrophosphatase MutT (NUDIX family)